jgi:hypothetical protein
MLLLHQSDKRLHNLEAVVSAVKLSVVVKRGTYTAICNSYRIIESYLHSGPNTDMRCIKLQSRIHYTHTYIHTYMHTNIHTYIHINICIIKIWLNNIK